MIDAINLGLVVLLMFFVLSLLRVPLFMALLLPCVGYVLLMDIEIVLISQRMIQTLNSFTIIAIPLFILVGSLMDHGDITDSIFDFASDVVGHYRGGVAQVNVLTSLLFSGISGSALADLGSIGKVLIGVMERDGYRSSYSAALTSASATIGPIFPPSVPLILYGLLANVSVLSLLLAGILPAVLATLILMLMTAILAVRDDFPSKPRQSRRRQLSSLFRASPALITPIVLIAGMLGGFFGPTEAAVVTVFYVIIVSLVFYSPSSPRFIWDASVETVQITASILIILAPAGLFAWIMSVEGIPAMFSDFLLSTAGNVIIALFLVNLFLLLLGLFLDPIAAMVMAVPIVVPPLIDLGVHPVHLGIIVTFNLMIGLLTPPLGVSIFLTADLADVNVVEVIKEMKVYYVGLFVVLLLITYVPEFSLIIPELTR